jgi:hypothetical protein
MGRTASTTSGWCAPISTIFSPTDSDEINTNMGLAHLLETRSPHGAAHARGVSYGLAEV